MPIERRLPTQGGASSAPAAAPRGWGARASSQTEEVDDGPQTGTTASKLRGPRQTPPPAEAHEEEFEQAPPRSRFSPGLQARMKGEASEVEVEDETDLPEPQPRHQPMQPAANTATAANTASEGRRAARDTEAHGPCTVSIHFHGTPTQVRQAMRDLLG